MSLRSCNKITFTLCCNTVLFMEKHFLSPRWGCVFGWVFYPGLRFGLAAALALGCGLSAASRLYTHSLLDEAGTEACPGLWSFRRSRLYTHSLLDEAGTEAALGCGLSAVRGSLPMLFFLPETKAYVVIKRQRRERTQPGASGPLGPAQPRVGNSTRFKLLGATEDRICKT